VRERRLYTGTPVWPFGGWRNGVNWAGLTISSSGITRHLTREDLKAAWDYVASHRDEIEQAIRENREA
jgi:hypothetical protein